MTKKFDRVLSDDWLPLEFQSGNSVPVTSVMVNRKTLKSIVEQTEQAVLQSPEIQEMWDALNQCRCALEPYDDVKPRDWKTDRENLRYAHRVVCAAIAKALGEEE